MPLTSVAAAESMASCAALLRRRVFLAVAMAGEEGLTRDEIVDRTGMLANTVRPRVVELMKEGRLRPSGMTRPTASGRAAEVLVVVR